MAQFDVFRGPPGMAYLLDCQSDLLSRLSHRFTVPLADEGDAPTYVIRLNPIFVIEGRRVVMLTQFAAAVPRSELRDHVVSLASEHLVITSAIDLLTGGV